MLAKPIMDEKLKLIRAAARSRAFLSTFGLAFPIMICILEGLNVTKTQNVAHIKGLMKKLIF